MPCGREEMNTNKMFRLIMLSLTIGLCLGIFIGYGIGQISVLYGFAFVLKDSSFTIDLNESQIVDEVMKYKEDIIKLQNNNKPSFKQVSKEMLKLCKSTCPNGEGYINIVDDRNKCECY